MKHRLTLAALQAGKLSPDIISVNRLKPCYFANSKIDGEWMFLPHSHGIMSHSQATTSYLATAASRLPSLLCYVQEWASPTWAKWGGSRWWAKCGFFQVASLQNNPALTQLVRHASRYIKYVSSMNIPNSYHPASPIIVLKFPRYGSQLNLMEHPPGVVWK